MNEVRITHAHALVEYESSQREISQTLMLVEANFVGPRQISAVLLLVEYEDEPAGIEAMGVEFTGSGTTAGMGVPLKSDRSAYRVDSAANAALHASDLPSAPNYHVIPGDEVGQVPIWDGAKWEPGSQPAGSTTVLKDGVSLGTADSFNFSGLSASVTGGTVLVSVLQPMQHSMAKDFPYHGAPTTLTPNNHGATVCRVHPFHLPYTGSWSNLYIRTSSAVNACLNVAIYSAAGARLWESTGNNTVGSGWVTISMGGLSLPAGDYYFATGNNGSTSTTTAYIVSIALSTAGVGPPPPKYGTIPTTGGAMPVSFTPATDITANAGGYMCFVILEK
jgi:hypothetical protein